jgi:hypothetical protein
MSSPIVTPSNAHAASGCRAAARRPRQDAPGEAFRHFVRAIAADRGADSAMGECSLSAKPVYGTAGEASPVRFARTIPGGGVVR